jgi:ADP-heptose:LPS heptosyltransferase
MHDEVRRRLGAGNYYDVSTILAGFPELCGKYKANIFFSDKENEVVAKEMAKFSGKFKIMMNLNGSGPHKMLVQAEQLAVLIRKNFKDAVIITTGDKLGVSRESDIAPDYSLIKIKAPFVQAMCTLKHMDCVIGTESGLLVASNALERPTIQLMTAASLENHPNGCINDYSLQSPAYCSPCHKGPYRYIGCPTKDKLPLCVYFDINKIMEKINAIYTVWKSKVS